MHALSLLTDPNAWAALVTLTVLEIVLGIDNLVFISVLVSRLDPTKAQAARAKSACRSPSSSASIMLFGLTWLMGLTQPLFTIFGIGISWRDIILIGGGLFLIAKATHEIHAEVEARRGAGNDGRHGQAFAWMIVAAGRRRPGILARSRSSPRSAWRRTSR